MLHDVSGTGKDGRITKEDAVKAVENKLHRLLHHLIKLFQVHLSQRT
jgi:pyruvate/2-oxoglutarate dehydrogenase complex dihydrolipoamide acyltransferase (E2) component